MNLEATTSSQTAPKPKTQDTIVGVVSLALLALLGVVAYPMVSGESDQGDDVRPASVQKPRATTSTIATSILEFQTGIPLLEKEGLVRTQDPYGIEYRWNSRSNSSWIAFTDHGADGKLERISAFLPMPSDNEATQVMSLALAYRISELAAGNKIDAGEFSDWVTSNIPRSTTEDVVRRFGTAPVRFIATQANGVNGLTFMIGE